MPQTQPENNEAILEEQKPALTGRATARKASIIIVSKALSKVVAAISALVLARLLTKEDFGLLQFIITAYLTVSTLAQLGLPESVFYFFERLPALSRKTFSLLMARLLVFMGLAGSVFLFVIIFFAPRWGFEVGWALIPLIILTVLDLPCSLTPNLLVAIDRTRQAAWFNLINSLLLFSATVGPAVFGFSLQTIVMSLVGYGVLRMLISGYFFVSNFPESGSKLPLGMTREVFAYSVPLALANMLWAANRYIDKYVVAAFLPVEVFAEYAIGAQEIPFLPTIAYSVATVMMPQFVAFFMQGDKDSILRLWLESIRKVSLIILPLMVLFILTAEEFIVLTVGEQYLNAALPFRIYTLILFQRVTSYSAVLKAIGKTRVVTNHAIYTIILNVVLSIPLVILMGVAGPPTATVLAGMVTWVYVMLRIRDALETKLRDTFPFGHYFKTLFVSVLAGLPILVLDIWLDAPVAIELVVKIVVYLTGYLVVALAAGVCEKQDLKFIAGLVGIKGRKQKQ